MSVADLSSGRNVFINCPFDSSYQGLFWAIVFTVVDCGFTPRCALEASDSGEVRIEKILNIIEQSHLGVHDISATELDSVNSLPRFNMPLELGLFLGSKRFGSEDHKRKVCVVFDREKFRYQKFISDIAGQDIFAHSGEEKQLIKHLRNWLSGIAPEKIADGGSINARFESFMKDAPQICAKANLNHDNVTIAKDLDLTFKDLVYVITVWSNSQIASLSSPS